jgi:hypothetical protein
MTTERRAQRDRRRIARGGRRPGDAFGYSPLIMVIDADYARRDLTEAILAKLQFAVAPVESAEKAITIAHALRPSVIVCAPRDARDLRDRLRFHVPIVPIADDTAITDALVEVVRAALHATPVQ